MYWIDPGRYYLVVTGKTNFQSPSFKVGDAVYPDIAWTYNFPTRQLLPIAGLIAFYNEKVDITLDGRALERPVTHFS